MNMQAMLKQAQKLQKEMMNTKSEIDEKEYTSKSSLVEVKMKGTKEVIDVKIEADLLEKDDIEALQDMFMVAVNDCIKQIDKETNDKLGKYTNGMPGLF